jgi:TrmH family RNA methyltransferase
MHKKSLLDNISIVLVDTKTPANIGAAARCMLNMGLSHLVLVNPPDDPAGEALKLAAGADGVLDQARCAATLAEAVKDHELVLGTSRHTGRLRKNVLTPHDAVKAAVPLLSCNKVAIVFGNEVNGLTREDLSFCHELISIPSSDAFPSLNLSHAVMIVAYELFLASGNAPVLVDRDLAPSEAVEEFHRHLQNTLLNTGFLDRNKPARMMSVLRQIFGRARLSQKDVAVLRGILTSVERAAGFK